MVLDVRPMNASKARALKVQNKARFGHSAFARGLRAAVRGYWSGALDYVMFYETFSITLEQGLTSAWYAGAAMCGILPEELSVEEVSELRYRIAEQSQHINRFAEAIERGSKANKGKLTPLLQRVQLWVNRYNDVKNEAQVMACKDQKLVWRLGATERHCRTCSALDGKVKRASFWRKIGVRPQNAPNNLLECGGWKCDCSFNPTDLPLSRGALPALP